MANKLVYEVGVSTPKITMKRKLILFLLGIICLTLIEAGTVVVDRSPFKHLPVQTFFYFKESNNVLFLDYNYNVWVSSNAGASWELAPGIPKSVAAALYKHPFSNDKAYILTNKKTHYKTSDKGKTWQEFTTPIVPARKVQVLSFHAHREDHLLFRGTECIGLTCTDITYYTKNDFAETKKLLENTDRCIWAHNNVKFDEAPMYSIFCINYDVSGSGSMRKLSDYRLVESEDFFETTKIIDFDSGGDVRGVIGLGETEEFLLAAVKNPYTYEMKMYVSVDGLKWARAFFPLNKGPKEKAYTILESPTNHLVVDLLSTEYSTGSLFISNSNGTYFVNSLNHTHRNTLGTVDFRLSNIGGHFIANIVSNFDDSEDERKKLQSKITFDDGATWKFIKPPERNLDNTDFQCRGNWEDGTCSLHLHLDLAASGRNIGHIFSTSAPGVLMGVGNVGEYLLPYDQCDTFLSYDGGLTWKVVKLGAHSYGVGHYGSVLVIIDDEQPTDYFLYSYDRGEQWHRKDLGTKIRAKFLTTDSESKSKAFLLLGSAVSDHDTPDDGSGYYRHFTFKLDFSNLFDRDCNRNEFDDWVLTRSGDIDSDCFMGKKTTYHRRKADAQCFVSNLPDPDDIICACTKRDYECDFNYIFDKDKEMCIPLVPERGECKEGQKTYTGSSGFRLIPGDLCDPDRKDSIRHDPVERECNVSPIFGEITHRTANYAIIDYFYFVESQVLIIRTIDGKVKRSKDEGTTWDDVLLDAGPIFYMSKHDHDNDRAYFFPNKADKADNQYYMWYTTDRGENFGRTKLESEPSKFGIKLLDFHPEKQDWLLYMGSISSYFSPDNGETWKEIETWADKCMFGKDTEFSETEDDLVFCSSYKYKNSNTPNPLQLVKMKTNGESKEVLFSDVINFYIFHEFMAVATEERGQLLLHTSTNGIKFYNATFPPNLSVNKKAFTLLPSATGSIFLDAYKSLRFAYGSLFKSNSEGSAFNRILDNTNRNAIGNVDFEKVVGLDGIILANQVENIDELNDGLGKFVEKKIITKISHDDGAHWKRLKVDGYEGCQDDCYLNLHGRTDTFLPDSIFSAPSAIGLLIGVGNVGRYLLPYNECNTFMSRDGGKTWREIRHGASLYEFGDQGTIIVLIDNKGPTDHVLYSWNYGKDWEKYQFTSTPVRAILLTANLNSTSMKFLLYGYSTRDTSPVLVTIDFSQLEKKQCEESDFELWNPMDDSGDHTCLLGEWREYQRRKEDSICKVASKLQPKESKICKCTKHDFDCADGYWRNAKGECELRGPDPDRPANCRGKYKGHSGYVKMKKSKCEGGLDLDKKIDKDCNPGNIIISKTSVLNQRIVNYFYFNESHTILALTMDNVVWRGTDEGHTWETPNELKKEKVYAILQNTYFNEYAYCITRDKIFYTSDSGASFEEIEVKMEPNNFQLPVLSFHPDKPEYLIYTGSKGCESIWSPDCHTEAFYTKDNKHWESLETYVRVCQWARSKKFRPSDEYLIICESYRDKKGSQTTFYDNPLQLVSVSSFKNKEPIKENVIGAVVFEEYMVVAELLPSGQSLRLSVSLDAKIFAEAQFPPNIPIIQEAYTALQSTTNAIMLHVTTSSIKSKNKYGSILKSNWNGTYYSLSLENANRDEIGFVDFEKMQGIKGIAVANVVSNVYEVNLGNDKKLKTKITFNDGANWSLLNRPDTDSNGHKYECSTGPVDECSLHLHSFTERRNPRDSLSSSSAVGLMMGVGNVGDHLTPYLEGDTFLTRDAGLTWIEVKKGAYMYEFGDQGGILVLVDDEQPTDSVLYSLNEGLEWQEYKFTKVGEQPIRVFDIDIMPGGLSGKFILRGLNPSSANEEVIVYIDFSSVFARDCKMDEDFEKWSPEFQDGCLFGHKIAYLRKNRTIECFINENLRYKKERGEDCVCSDHDFECEYNYIRNAITGECELFPGAQPIYRDMAEQCANDDYYRDPSPKRKLASSTCKGGPNSYPCPRGRSALFWIIIVLSPFVIVGILTICFINRRHGGFGYSTGRIRLGGSIEPDSVLQSIVDIFYQIRMPRFVSRLWSNIPLPGRRNRYHYSPVATDDGEVLMDDYDQDNETL